ncbi:uncharacterized protein Tco025E_02481, partial [Trypanosoma conorhini]
MSTSWKVIDFCRYFGVEAAVDPAAVAPAAAHHFFHHLTRTHGIAAEAAAARLRTQNAVEAILREEGLDDDGALALDVLRGEPAAADTAALRVSVARLLHDRRRLACAVTPAGKEAGRLLQAPAEPRVPAATGPAALWNSLVAIEAALFSAAVELSRRSDEVDAREAAAVARVTAVELAEAELRQRASARQQEALATEAELAARRTALQVEAATLEERRAQLARAEAALDARAAETRRAEEAVAAARATLAAGQAALEEDRRQCAAVAHGLVDRERRLKAAEALLAQAKDDLTTYEHRLTLA